MSKFCSKCGKQVDVNKKFCPYCGHSLKISKKIVNNTLENKNFLSGTNRYIVVALSIVVLGLVGFITYNHSNENKKVEKTTNVTMNIKNTEANSKNIDASKSAYIKRVVKEFSGKDISIISFKEKIEQGVKVTVYTVKQNGNQFENTITAYEKDGIVWQIVGRDICDRLIYCRDDKVYKVGAFLPNKNGQNTYFGDVYVDYTLDLASGKIVARPMI